MDSHGGKRLHHLKGCETLSPLQPASLCQKAHHDGGNPAAISLLNSASAWLKVVTAAPGLVASDGPFFFVAKWLERKTRVPAGLTTRHWPSRITWPFSSHSKRWMET